MANLIILGTSNAVPDENHESTHMALRGQKGMLLIDSGSNPLLRLRQAGLDYQDLTDLILTHFHPDHVSGVPLLLMHMWLLGHRRSLQIHGLGHTLDRLEKLMVFYDWENWPGFFPVTFHRLPQREKALVLENDEFRILASPVHHMIPTIGLRIETLNSGKALAYSCDTEPCAEVVGLAAGVDYLIHEASGGFTGHSSAAQAGEIARQAQAGALYLVHYPTGDADSSGLLEEARQVFAGEVVLAEDFMEIAL